MFFWRRRCSRCGESLRFMAKRSLGAYLADDLCQSAVERQLEIAGDALGQLRKLDAVLFGKIPDGDLVVAFRNVLAHGYATLDIDASMRSPQFEPASCLRPWRHFYRRCPRGEP